jgi:hypothetical protein
MIGTLAIDLQFRGVGRLPVRSGTTTRQVRDAMKQMLRTLYQIGRIDVLRDIKSNKVGVGSTSSTGRASFTSSQRATSCAPREPLGRTG